MATKIPVTKYFRPFIPPLPPGTKLHNDLFWDVYIYRPYCRLWERVGVYLYNRVINRFEVGVQDKEYNARVHGPYCPWRYYGTKSMVLFESNIVQGILLNPCNVILKSHFS